MKENIKYKGLLEKREISKLQTDCEILTELKLPWECAFATVLLQKSRAVPNATQGQTAKVNINFLNVHPFVSMNQTGVPQGTISSH